MAGPFRKRFCGQLCGVGSSSAADGGSLSRMSEIASGLVNWPRKKQALQMPMARRAHEAEERGNLPRRAEPDGQRFERQPTQKHTDIGKADQHIDLVRRVQADAFKGRPDLDDISVIERGPESVTPPQAAKWHVGKASPLALLLTHACAGSNSQTAMAPAIGSAMA